jgi:hypothetical protein
MTTARCFTSVALIIVPVNREIDKMGFMSVLLGSKVLGNRSNTRAFVYTRDFKV